MGVAVEADFGVGEGVVDGGALLGGDAGEVVEGGGAWADDAGTLGECERGHAALPAVVEGEVGVGLGAEGVEEGAVEACVVGEWAAGAFFRYLPQPEGEAAGGVAGFDGPPFFPVGEVVAVDGDGTGPDFFWCRARCEGGG